VNGPTISEYYGLIRLPTSHRLPYLTFRYGLPVSLSGGQLPNTLQESGTHRVSQVLDVSLQACHALNLDPDRPSENSPLRSLCVGFRAAKPVAVCFLCTITGLYQASESAIFLVAYLVPCVRFKYVVRIADTSDLCPFFRLIGEAGISFSNAEIFLIGRSLLKPA
jgi:hypothetical protein